MEGSFEELLAQKKAKFLELLPLPGKYELLKSEDGFSMHTQVNPDNGLKINRGSTVTDLTTEQILAVTFDITQRQNYDPMCESGTLVKKIDENTQIVHVKSKSPAFMIDKRDFVILQRIYREGDVTILLTTSVNLQSHPPIKDYVRGEQVIAGQYLRKLENGKTEVINVGNVNPNGSIPSAVLNQGSGKALEALKNLIKYIQKK